MAATINSFSTPGGILDNKVIITLEDPIENEFDSTESVRVVQKELGKDFRTFALGIKASLREHPNMIIVGECRDKEVICAAIEAARTGHITSTTFHAADVAGTVNRLLYHLDNDKNLSLDLIMQLNIILSQKMLKQEGKYLVDTQYLLFTPQVREMLSNTLKAGGDLSEQINKMIADPQYQAIGWVKDWDYKHLHGEGG
jgi:twitching motility protein PilT